MKHPQLVFVSCCCCFSIFTATSCSTVEGYSCVTAYWDTVTCVLNITGDPSNTTYSLKFRSIDEPTPYNCPLVGTSHSYRTDCKVVDSGTVDQLCNYDIDLCTSSNTCQSLTKNFYPRDHIQLTVPSDVKVQQTPGNFNFTWRSGYETHIFFSHYLEYEVLLEAAESKESEPVKRRLRTRNEEFLSVPRSHLQSYDTYCVKVRSILDYSNGMWSEWSNRTCWGNHQEQEREKSPVIATILLVPVCVVAAVLLFLFYSPAVRMKVKTLSHTPSPAPFFQPLFQQHKGNLQDWLSPQSKCMIIYKTEEMPTTDAVTVEPKPLDKELEENLDFPDPPVMLPQGHTSYVGLPGSHQAPAPVAVVCPGNSSYTRLPWPVWGFTPGGIQVEPSPSEISRSDSGCSFGSLSGSPDCSLPSSPTVEPSPPFHCNDYCILNKTAAGVVPVLVAKGSSPGDAGGPHQDEDES